MLPPPMELPREHSLSRRRTSARRRGRQGSQTDKLAELVLVVLVFTSLLTLGAVPFWAAWTSAGIALVGGALGAAAFPQLPRPVWALLGLSAFSALQAAPLPFQWLMTLAPTTAEVWTRSQVPFGSPPPRFASLSLDPGASLLEALKWAAYASTFLLAARVRGQRGNAWLAALVFAAGACAATLTLLHGALNLQTVFGIYHPTFKVQRWSVGPLLNSNNLAGYVSLGVFAGVALLLSDRSPLSRALVGAGILVSVCALALSGSRGGAIASLAGGAALTVMLWRSRRDTPEARSRFPLLAPVGAGVLVAIAIGSTRNLDSLTTGDITRKLATWRWSMTMLRDHPWFGVGRGAFETALPPYRQALPMDWSASFSHAENFVVQWLVDWGVPVGGVAVLAFLAFVANAWLKARAVPHRLALLTGVAALLLQNLVDLGLELPSLVILTIVALVGGGDSVALVRPQHRTLRRRLVPLLGAPLAVGWLACAVVSRRPVGSERNALSERYRQLNVAEPEQRAEFRATLAAAMKRHPGEPYFPLLGGLVAYRGGDQNPVPWLSRALERSPTSGPVHLALGQVVAHQGNARQAMLHLKLAVQYDSTLAGDAGRRVANIAPSVALLMESIPAGPRGASMLMAACEASTPASFKLECLRAGFDRAPDDVAFAKRYVEVTLATLADDGEACADEQLEGCVAQVEAGIRRLNRLTPGTWQANYYRAKLLSLRGLHTEAAQILADACPAGPAGAECSREFVQQALVAGTEELRVRAIEAYAARECASPPSCAAANDWLAVQLSQTNNHQLALLYGSHAAESLPTAGRWLRVAELAIVARRYTEARTAIARSEVAQDATPESRAKAGQLSTQILAWSFAARR